MGVKNTIMVYMSRIIFKFGVFMENMAYRLKLIRQHFRLTQAEFAQRYNIKQQSISKYEKGTLSIPDDLKINLLKNGVNIHWLLTGEGEMFVNSAQGLADPGVENCRDCELEELKKSITTLEKECAELQAKNQELNSELLDRFRELLKLKDRLIIQES